MAALGGLGRLGGTLTVSDDHPAHRQARRRHAATARAANDDSTAGAAPTRMTGVGGDDLYYVDNAGDMVIEGAAEGALDRVFASVSYTLAAGSRSSCLTTDQQCRDRPRST